MRFFHCFVGGNTLEKVVHDLLYYLRHDKRVWALIIAVDAHVCLYGPIACGGPDLSHIAIIHLDYLWLVKRFHVDFSRKWRNISGPRWWYAGKCAGISAQPRDAFKGPSSAQTAGKRGKSSRARVTFGWKQRLSKPAFFGRSRMWSRMASRGEPDDDVTREVRLQLGAGGERPASSPASVILLQQVSWMQLQLLRHLISSG